MIGSKIHRFHEVSSTNKVAFKLARDGAKDGEVVIAEGQTKGRGRMDRSWESPTGKNIYLSIILRPIKRENLSTLTLVAGVAAIETLKPLTNGKLGIKWPNDVWLNGKKICGILTEMEKDIVVVGIGINVNSDKNDFSHDVREIATSLYITNHKKYDISAIIDNLCHRLDHLYRIWSAGGFPAIKEMYKTWSLIDGKKVRVTFSDKISSGVVQGIDDTGALLLKTDDGWIEKITAGDVNLICS